MRTKTQAVITLLFVAGSGVFCAASATIDKSDLKLQEKATLTARVKLNEKAFAHARELLKKGQVVPDGKGSWRAHRPSAAQENEFIRLRGFDEYANWYLGVDEEHAENTKLRYKFPYGDFQNLHRCALLAAASRAGQYRYYEIENAAKQLEEMIETKKVFKSVRNRALPLSFRAKRGTPQSQVAAH